MEYIVIGYYTRNTLYEAEAREFISSLIEFDIPYYVEAIDNLGDWFKNTSYKPIFIKRMLLKFPEVNIVYVDVDARFLRYPSLFEELNCNIAIHHFNRNHYKRRGVTGFEVLSGTIFLQNNKEVFDLIEKWEEECKSHPRILDQKSLGKVLRGRFYNLPEEYCTIFDTMSHVKNPVIIHNQVSRKIRKNRGSLVL